MWAFQSADWSDNFLAKITAFLVITGGIRFDFQFSKRCHSQAIINFRAREFMLEVEQIISKIWRSHGIKFDRTISNNSHTLIFLIEIGSNHIVMLPRYFS